MSMKILWISSFFIDNIDIMVIYIVIIIIIIIIIINIIIIVNTVVVVVVVLAVFSSRWPVIPFFAVAENSRYQRESIQVRKV